MSELTPFAFLTWSRFARRIFTATLISFFANAGINAQTAVFDKARSDAQDVLIGVMENISKRMDDVKKLDDEKLRTQSKISDQLGAISTASLQGTSVKTDIDLSAQSASSQTRALVDGGESGGSAYTKWDEQRRAAELVMNSQLAALLKSGEKPLDWAGHAQLSAKIKTLTNDRIASSIVSANATTERRIKNKQDEARALQLELEADQRDAAQARINTILRN